MPKRPRQATDKDGTGEYARPNSMARPGELQKQGRRIEVQYEEKMQVNYEGATPSKTQKQAHSRKRAMEEVVSPSDMEEISPSDKRQKMAKEEVLIEFKSVDKTIDTVKRLSGILEIFCKKHKVTPGDIKENARQLAKAARTLVRTKGLRKKAELERRGSLKEQNATMLE